MTRRMGFLERLYRCGARRDGKAARILMRAITNPKIRRSADNLAAA